MYITNKKKIHALNYLRSRLPLTVLLHFAAPKIFLFPPFFSRLYFFFVGGRRQRGIYLHWLLVRVPTFIQPENAPVDIEHCTMHQNIAVHELQPADQPIKQVWLCFLRTAVLQINLLTTVLNDAPVLPDDDDEDAIPMLMDSPQCVLFGIFIIWSVTQCALVHS